MMQKILSRKFFLKLSIYFTFRNYFPGWILVQVPVYNGVEWTPVRALLCIPAPVH